MDGGAPHDGEAADALAPDAAADGAVDPDAGPSDAGPSDAGSPDAAVILCGNGVIDTGEQCDDGNPRSHDGCSSGCTQEQPTWQELSPAHSPAIRWGHAMAYDPVRGVTVLFGGHSSADYGDTWEFDGQDWVETTPSTGSPSPRRGAAMAYLPSLGSVVLFGGVSGDPGVPVGDTWFYHQGQGQMEWTEVTYDPTPSPRSFPAMVLDPAAGVIQLFGGEAASGALGDQWTFNGSAWSEVTLSSAPSVRAEAAFAYDAGRGVMVLFGGSQGAVLDDTWEYDGTSWTGPGPTGPSRRYWSAMAYDALLGRCVLFGGDGTGGSLGDTWEYDGAAWVQRPILSGPSPSDRGRFAMVYDAERAVTLLFGGYGGVNNNETWVYRWESGWPDELCDDGADNDGDGQVDCQDPDCESRRCASGVCHQGACQ